LDQLKFPHNLEIERWVLGNVIFYGGFSRINELHFSRDLFYSDQHQLIADAIMALDEQNAPIEVDSIMTRVVASETFDRGLLGEIADRGASTQNAEFYMAELRNLSIKRQMIRASQELMRAGMSDEAPSPSIMRHTDKLMGYVHELAKSEKEPITWDEQIEEGIQSLEERIRNPLGILTGFPSLDSFLGGLHKEYMIVIGARPGTGKTAIGAQIWAQAAAEGRNVMFCSVEMSRSELLHRTIIGRSNLSFEDLNTGKLSENDNAHDAIMATVRKMKDWQGGNIKESTTLRLIKKDIRAFKRRLGEEPIDLIVVDYLQKIKTEERFAVREREVARISEALKEIAKEYKCPVLALAQLNREKKQGEKPEISDLRESGAIEQDADQIILMHRDMNHTILTVAKNRHGNTGALKLKFLEKQIMFVEEQR